MVSIMALKILKLFIITLYVSSCSSNSSLDRLKTFSEIYFNQNLENPYKVFTKQELNQIKYPIIEVRTNHILKQALMIPISRRFNYYNYISGSGQALTFNGDAIIKTSGMDLNLISLSLQKESPLKKNIPVSEWPLEENKKYLLLMQSFEAIEYSFKCKFSVHENIDLIIINETYDVSIVKENCTNQNYKFENIYYVDEKGFIWKSKQFIPSTDRFIDITKLKL